MGKADRITKIYVQDKAVARDLIRLAHPDLAVKELRELNPERVVEAFESDDEKRKDLVKSMVRLRDAFFDAGLETFTDDETAFVLIGLEHQRNVEAVMPIRVLLSNTIDYMWQAEEYRKKHAAEEKAQGKTDVYPHRHGEGMRLDDMLKPILTIVIYWGPGEWNGPRHLQSLMKIPPGISSSEVDNNTVCVIEPAKLTDAQINSCTSSLREVLKFLRSANDPAALRELLANDPAFQTLEVEAAHLLEEITATRVRLPKNYKKGEKVNMCLAIEEMFNERTRALQTELATTQADRQTLQTELATAQNTIRALQAEIDRLRSREK